MKSPDDPTEGAFNTLHLSSLSRRGPRRLYEDEQLPFVSQFSNICQSDATQEPKESGEVCVSNFSSGLWHGEKHQVDNYPVSGFTSLTEHEAESMSTPNSGTARSRTRRLWTDSPTANSTRKLWSPSLYELGDVASMPDQPTMKFSSKKTKTMPRSISCSAISDVKSRLYNKYTVCRMCGSNSIISVADAQDGTVLVMMCYDCDDVYGVDDSMTYTDVLTLYEKGRFQMNAICCDNTNVNQFLLVAADATGLQVKCLKCDKVSSIGFDLELNAEIDENFSSRHQKDKLKCRCGNEDLEKMHLYMFKEDVNSISCDICGDFIDVQESTCIDVPTCDDTTLRDNDDYSQFISCKCKPGKNNIQIDRDAKGEINMIACSTCQYFYLPKEQYFQSQNIASHDHSMSCHSQDPKDAQYRRRRTSGNMSCKKESHMQKKQTSDPSKPSKSDDNQPSYYEVRSLSDLQRGDHIMWDRKEGYYHHAIIEHVIQHTGRITVVHYNGPMSRKIKGKIMAEMLDPFDKSAGKLFRVDYTKCDEPDVVLTRAYERFGEIQYNIITNNCEHFATWCKTGEKKCYQVISVMQCIEKYAWGVGKEVLSDGVQGLLLMAGATLPFAKQANGLLGKAFIGPIGLAAMAAGEFKQCRDDVMKAREDKVKGLLTTEGCAQIVFKRVGRGAGGVIGRNLGCLIPIPVLGKFIGGLLGGVIGEYLGMFAGKGILHLDNMCGKNIQKRVM